MSKPAWLDQIVFDCCLDYDKIWGHLPSIRNLQQESFTKYRAGLAANLLSASELDDISTTDTEASESESEEPSAEDQLAGSMSAGSNTGTISFMSYTVYLITV